MTSWLVKVYDEQGFLRGMQLFRSRPLAHKFAREGSLTGFSMVQWPENGSAVVFGMTWFMNGDRLFFQSASNL